MTLRRWLWCSLASVGLFLVSLTVPAVDTNYGELIRGFSVRGYQCAVGLFVMPLVVPLATPLWLTLVAGNLWILASPALIGWYPEARLTRGLAWWALPAAAAVVVLTVLSDLLGLGAFHSGYFLWAASLLIAALGNVLFGTSALAGRRREGST